MKWKNAIIAPSNSVPWSVLIVTGEKDFHKIDSQIFVAIKREIPDPRPYPFCKSSSSIKTINPAKNNYPIINTDLIIPSSPTGPYIPERR